MTIVPLPIHYHTPEWTKQHGTGAFVHFFLFLGQINSTTRRKDDPIALDIRDGSKGKQMLYLPMVDSALDE
jgi:hypothetical protein